VLDDDFRRAIEAIKNRAAIEDVVRERVPTLRKRGVLWEACCPFHEERTPSFKVDPRRGTWHCYGSCSTGGDQISFLERIDNLSFVEVLEILAARTGVELPRRRREDPARRDEEQKLRAALESAANYYRRHLKSPEGARAGEYVAGRGLTDTTAEAFGVGYAPASGTALVEHLRAQGHEFETLEKAGLARRNDAGRAYDFFRGRLMIPIRDSEGGVIGFGGRRLADDDASGPKYVNTPETELFKKGRLIYAWDRALPNVRRGGRVALVEGYTDVMAAHQVGVNFVAAVLGTATTEDHAALVRKSGARVVQLVFDGDEAGRKAAYKALHGLLPLELELQVAMLTGGDDPCDVCVREGSAGFLAHLDTAQPWFSFLIEGLRGKRGMELSQEIDRVLGLLTRLKKPVLRESLIGDLAKAIDLPVAALREQYNSLPEVVRERQLSRGTLIPQRPPAAQSAPQQPAQARAAVPVVTAAAVRVDPRELAAWQDVLGGLLLAPAYLPYLRGREHQIPDSDLAVLFGAVTTLYEEDGAVTEGGPVTQAGADSGLDLNALLARLGDHPARHRVSPLLDRASRADDLKVLLEGALRTLWKLDYEREQRRIQARFKELEGQEGASEEIGQLALRLRELQTMNKSVK
jgi:DNA primase